jgi:hypothetical protein
MRGITIDSVILPLKVSSLQKWQGHDIIAYREEAYSREFTG